MVLRPCLLCSQSFQTPLDLISPTKGKGTPRSHASHAHGRTESLDWGHISPAPHTAPTALPGLDDDDLSLSQGFGNSAPFPEEQQLRAHNPRELKAFNSIFTTLQVRTLRENHKGRHHQDISGHLTIVQGLCHLCLLLLSCSLQ